MQGISLKSKNYMGQFFSFQPWRGRLSSYILQLIDRDSWSFLFMPLHATGKNLHAPPKNVRGNCFAKNVFYRSLKIKKGKPFFREAENKQIVIRQVEAILTAGLWQLELFLKYKKTKMFFLSISLFSFMYFVLVVQK